MILLVLWFSCEGGWEKPVVLSEAVVPTDVGSRKVDLL